MAMRITDTEIYKFIEDYIDQIELVKYKHGDYIDRATNDTSCIYYILSGVVKVQNISHSGNKVLIDEISIGEFVGHISNIRGEGFHCDILAKEACTLVKITPVILEKLLKNSEFSSLFYKKTSQRIYCMYKKLLLEHLFPWEEIVAYYIVQHTKGDVFIYKSMYEICEYLSISRRGLYNIINKLVGEGCLEKQDNMFLVKNKKDLLERSKNVYQYYNEVG